MTRWLSSTIGEGLILDLRTAVFDHVQRMPVAFFTRTRTGALVSRLGNDVMGAQRAFSDTLSGVVTNVVTLTLTLAVMLSISWQITLLSLVLMPLFLIPARRIGAAMARLSREAAAHNATMNTQMTERFSAPGRDAGEAVRQTRPPNRASSGCGRAGSATSGCAPRCCSRSFMNSLTLMSALALALVYGLGGVLAIGGHLQAGAIVSLALLLTRLYSPLTALANARVEIASALVSFERVFEVLDLVPLIQEKPDAVAVPDGPVSVEFDDVRFSYPSADKVSLASLEEVAELRRPRRRRGAARHFVHRAARADGGAGRVVRRGQVDDRVAAGPALRRRLRRGPAQRRRRARRDVRVAEGHRRHGHPGRAPVPRVDPVQSAAGRAGGHRRRAVGGAASAPGSADVVAEMPDGLDTVVGERGYRLSGGQRQRLTIARLLLGSSRVVVLDEATASLDSESEAAVQQALAEALAGRTSIVIAHRLSTVRAADMILVVEDGRIVERGTHDQLLARGGRYAELYETQFGTQADADDVVAA